MPMMRIRLTGSEDDVRATTNLLQSLDGIEHVEEIDDLMPHMDDADSSSGRPERRRGPGYPRTGNRRAQRRDRAEGPADGGGVGFDLDVVVAEFEEDEG